MSKPLVHRVIEATAPEVDRVLRRSRRTALKGIRKSVRQLDPVGLLVHGLVASLSQAALDRGAMKTAPVAAPDPATPNKRYPDAIDVEYRVVDVTPK